MGQNKSIIFKAICFSLVITFCFENILWANPEAFKKNVSNGTLQVQSKINPIATPELLHQGLIEFSLRYIVQAVDDIANINFPLTPEAPHYAKDIKIVLDFSPPTENKKEGKHKEGDNWIVPCTIFDSRGRYFWTYEAVIHPDKSISWKKKISAESAIVPEPQPPAPPVEEPTLAPQASRPLPNPSAFRDLHRSEEGARWPFGKRQLATQDPRRDSDRVEHALGKTRQRYELTQVMDRIVQGVKEKFGSGFVLAIDGQKATRKTTLSEIMSKGISDISSGDIEVLSYTKGMYERERDYMRVVKRALREKKLVVCEGQSMVQILEEGNIFPDLILYHKANLMTQLYSSFLRSFLLSKAYRERMLDDEKKGLSLLLTLCDWAPFGLIFFIWEVYKIFTEKKSDKETLNELSKRPNCVTLNFSTYKLGGLTIEDVYGIMTSVADSASYPSVATVEHGLISEVPGAPLTAEDYVRQKEKEGAEFILLYSREGRLVRCMSIKEAKYAAGNMEIAGIALRIKEGETQFFEAGRTDFETGKIVESLDYTAEMKEPKKVYFVVPMHKEMKRLLPETKDNPYGEDALRKTVWQLQEGSRINRRFKWQLILVDDGTPGNASAKLAEKLWAEIQEEYASWGETLDPSQVIIEKITPREKKKMKSRKGGAVLRGFNIALKSASPGDYIGYTDLDISTDMRQTGFLLKALAEGDAEVAIGSRWAKGGKGEKVPPSGIVSSKVYNLLVQTLMPPLRGIQDTQRSFKLFTKRAAEEILRHAKDNGFAFDTELLLLAKLLSYRTSEVPIAWIDSPGATTLSMFTDGPKMVWSLFRQRRHMFGKMFRSSYIMTRSGATSGSGEGERPLGLIGKWMLTPEAKFKEDHPGCRAGDITFMARRIDYPERDEIEIKLRARCVPFTEFDNFRRTGVEEIDSALKEFLYAFTSLKVKGVTLYMEPNRYGIYGIGTKDIIAVRGPLRFSKIAKTHEIMHAALDAGALTLKTVIDNIKGGEKALNEYIGKNPRRQVPGMRAHYALRLLFRQRNPIRDKLLTRFLKIIQPVRDFLDIRLFGGLSLAGRAGILAVFAYVLESYVGTNRWLLLSVIAVSSIILVDVWYSLWEKWEKTGELINGLLGTRKGHETLTAEVNEIVFDRYPGRRWIPGNVKEALKLDDPSADTTYIIASFKKSNVPIGYLAFTAKSTDAAITCVNLWINEKHRHKGIALKLLERFLEEAERRQKKSAIFRLKKNEGINLDVVTGLLKAAAALRGARIAIVPTSYGRLIRIWLYKSRPRTQLLSAALPLSLLAIEAAKEEPIIIKPWMEAAFMAGFAFLCLCEIIRKYWDAIKENRAVGYAIERFANLIKWLDDFLPIVFLAAILSFVPCPKVSPSAHAAMVTQPPAAAGVVNTLPVAAQVGAADISSTLLDFISTPVSIGLMIGLIFAILCMMYRKVAAALFNNTCVYIKEMLGDKYIRFWARFQEDREALERLFAESRKTAQKYSSSPQDSVEFYAIECYLIARRKGKVKYIHFSQELAKAFRRDRRFIGRSIAWYRFRVRLKSLWARILLKGEGLAGDGLEDLQKSIRYCESLLRLDTLIYKNREQYARQIFDAIINNPERFPGIKEVPDPDDPGTHMLVYESPNSSGVRNPKDGFIKPLLIPTLTGIAAPAAGAVLAAPYFAEIPTYISDILNWFASIGAGGALSWKTIAILVTFVPLFISIVSAVKGESLSGKYRGIWRERLEKALRKHSKLNKDGVIPDLATLLSIRHKLFRSERASGSLLAILQAYQDLLSGGIIKKPKFAPLHIFVLRDLGFVTDELWAEYEVYITSKNNDEISEPRIKLWHSLVRAVLKKEDMLGKDGTIDDVKKLEGIKPDFFTSRKGRAGINEVYEAFQRAAKKKNIPYRYAHKRKFVLYVLRILGFLTDEMCGIVENIDFTFPSDKLKKKYHAALAPVLRKKDILNEKGKVRDIDALLRVNVKLFRARKEEGKGVSLYSIFISYQKKARLSRIKKPKHATWPCFILYSLGFVTDEVWKGYLSYRRKLLLKRETRAAERQSKPVPFPASFNVTQAQLSGVRKALEKIHVLDEKGMIKSLGAFDSITRQSIVEGGGGPAYGIFKSGIQRTEQALPGGTDLCHYMLYHLGFVSEAVWLEYTQYLKIKEALKKVNMLNRRGKIRDITALLRVNATFLSNQGILGVYLSYVRAHYEFKRDTPKGIKLHYYALYRLGLVTEELLREYKWYIRLEKALRTRLKLDQNGKIRDHATLLSINTNFLEKEGLLEGYRLYMEAHPELAKETPEGTEPHHYLLRHLGLFAKALFTQESEGYAQLKNALKESEKLTPEGEVRDLKALLSINIEFFEKKKVLEAYQSCLKTVAEELPEGAEGCHYVLYSLGLVSGNLWTEYTWYCRLKKALKGAGKLSPEGIIKNLTSLRGIDYAFFNEHGIVRISQFYTRRYPGFWRGIPRGADGWRYLLYNLGFVDDELWQNYLWYAKISVTLKAAGKLDKQGAIRDINTLSNIGAAFFKEHDISGIYQAYLEENPDFIQSVPEGVEPRHYFLFILDFMPDKFLREYKCCSEMKRALEKAGKLNKAGEIPDLATLLGMNKKFFSEIGALPAYEAYLEFYPELEHHAPEKESAECDALHRMGFVSKELYQKYMLHLKVKQILKNSGKLDKTGKFRDIDSFLSVNSGFLREHKILNSADAFFRKNPELMKKMLATADISHCFLYCLGLVSEELWNKYETRCPFKAVLWKERLLDSHRRIRDYDALFSINAAFLKKHGLLSLYQSYVQEHPGFAEKLPEGANPRHYFLYRMYRMGLVSDEVWNGYIKCVTTPEFLKLNDEKRMWYVTRRYCLEAARIIRPGEIIQEAAILLNIREPVFRRKKTKETWREATRYYSRQWEEGLLGKFELENLDIYILKDLGLATASSWDEYLAYSARERAARIEKSAMTARGSVLNRIKGLAVDIQKAIEEGDIASAAAALDMIDKLCEGHGGRISLPEQIKILLDGFREQTSQMIDAGMREFADARREIEKGIYAAYADLVNLVDNIDALANPPVGEEGVEEEDRATHELLIILQFKRESLDSLKTLEDDLEVIRKKITELVGESGNFENTLAARAVIQLEELEEGIPKLPAKIEKLFSRLLGENSGKEEAQEPIEDIEVIVDIEVEPGAAKGPDLEIAADITIEEMPDEEPKTTETENIKERRLDLEFARDLLSMFDSGVPVTEGEIQDEIDYIESNLEAIRGESKKLWETAKMLLERLKKARWIVRIKARKCLAGARKTTEQPSSELIASRTIGGFLRQNPDKTLLQIMPLVVRTGNWVAVEIAIGMIREDETLKLKKDDAAYLAEIEAQLLKAQKAQKGAKKTAKSKPTRNPKDGFIKPLLIPTLTGIAAPAAGAVLAAPYLSKSFGLPLVAGVAIIAIILILYSRYSKEIKALWKMTCINLGDLYEDFSIEIMERLRKDHETFKWLFDYVDELVKLPMSFENAEKLFAVKCYLLIRKKGRVNCDRFLRTLTSALRDDIEYSRQSIVWNNSMIGRKKFWVHLLRRSDDSTTKREIRDLESEIERERILSEMEIEGAQDMLNGKENSVRRIFDLVCANPDFFPGIKKIPDSKNPEIGALAYMPAAPESSVADMGICKHVLLSVSPREETTLEKQTQEALSRAKKLLTDMGYNESAVVKQTVFLRSVSDKAECKEIIEAHYDRGPPPATSYIKEPPADGSDVTIEILAIKGENTNVRRVNEFLTVVEQENLKWAYVAGIEPDETIPDETIEDTYEQALNAFRKMKDVLEENGFNFEDVIRTWIYERDLLKTENGSQRYQLLNDARSEFFNTGDNGKKIHFGRNFRNLIRDPQLKEEILPPASTGIGMSGGTFVMECLALSTTRNDVSITPLENPDQVPAHKYSKKVLRKGRSEEEKTSPMFSRGMVVNIGGYKMTLISGTASIKGPKTVHKRSVKKQTKTTIENILRVIEQAGASLADIPQLRVYIKNSKHYKAIRKIVEERFPGKACVYLIADVCRDNLLVEIEAVAYTYQKPEAVTEETVLQETDPPKEAARREGKKDRPADEPHEPGVPVAETKGSPEDVMQFLRNLRIPKELAQRFVESITSRALGKKEIILAFEDAIGSGSDKSPLSIFEALKKLRKNPTFCLLLKNVDVVIGSSNSLHNKLQRHFAKPDTEVFLFARADSRERLRGVEGKRGVHSFYIKDKGFNIKDKDFTKNAYYPLLEIVTIALKQHIADLVSVSVGLDKLGIELEQLGIESILEEESTGVLVFTLLPNAKAHDKQALIKRYADLKRFIRSA